MNGRISCSLLASVSPLTLPVLDWILDSNSVGLSLGFCGFVCLSTHPSPRSIHGGLAPVSKVGAVLGSLLPTKEKGVGAQSQNKTNTGKNRTQTCTAQSPQPLRTRETGGASQHSPPSFHLPSSFPSRKNSPNPQSQRVKTASGRTRASPAAAEWQHGWMGDVKYSSDTMKLLESPIKM
jgi:hypothetical protein